MKEAILKVAACTNTQYKELIAFFVASYGGAWKEELRAMAEIVQPGDKLAIDHSINRIYAVTINSFGDLHVKYKEFRAR